MCQQASHIHTHLVGKLLSDGLGVFACDDCQANGDEVREMSNIRELFKCWKTENHLATFALFAGVNQVPTVRLHVIRNDSRIKIGNRQEEDNGGTSLNNPTTTSLKDHPTTPIDTSSSRLTLPTFKDLWGFEVQWQNTEDGWNPRRRERLIDLENKIIDQVAEMPAFTKEGYKKMKIPSHLYDLITQTINPEVIKTEWCDDFELSDGAWYPLYNCARIKEDGVTKGKLPINTTNS